MKRLVVMALWFTAAWAMAEAPDLAKIPYAVFHRMATLNLRGITGVTNQTVQMHITCDLPGVGPEQIKLFIDAKAGPVPIAMHPDGTFAVPIRPDLLAENPMVVANQPRGTMNLEVVASFHGATADSGAYGRVRYSDLFIAENAKACMLQELKPLSSAGYDFRQLVEHPTVVELTAKGESSTPPAVAIETTNGVIRLRPDTNGIFALGFDADLACENPWVQLSTNHAWHLETRMGKKPDP